MTLSDFKRWLYRGQRPNWIASVLNRAWAAIFSSGVAPDYLATLAKVGADDLAASGFDHR